MRRDDAFTTTNFGNCSAEVYHRVLDILEDILGIPREELLPEANFTEDLRADDMAPAEIIMAVEDEFGLEISDAEAIKLTTMRNLVDYISRETSESLAN